MANGSIKETEIPAVKLPVVNRRYVEMANLAIAELSRNGDCMTCDGRGFIRNNKTCRMCKGKRKQSWTHKYKAMFCLNIQLEDWKKTWSKRYGEVCLEVQPWPIEFESHLLRYC
jgi:RecJ-like exonuclease